MKRDLKGLKGRNYWRSLEELAGDPGFEEILRNEFHTELPLDGVNRRRFLQLMGASLALGGVTACTRQPKETIAPFSQAPEQLIPGRPLQYATATSLGGVGTGILVETHEGRPTKIEGNPLHPESLGAGDALTQASILGLYDPDRSQTVTFQGKIRPWSELMAALRKLTSAQEENGGAGLRILSGAITSPTLIEQRKLLLEKFPAARWDTWEPAGRSNAYEGSRLSFGQPMDVVCKPAEADVILSLDADFLGSGPGSTRMIREFSSRRKPDGDRPMNRLYVVENMPTGTGASADHRLAVKSEDVDWIARGIARRVGLAVPMSAAGEAVAGQHATWLDAVAKDLQSAGPNALVTVGACQPPHVHALANSLNHALGNSGRTVVTIDPIEGTVADADHPVRPVETLLDEMRSGDVSLLLIMGSNPGHALPGFAEAVESVGLRFHLGLYQDETAVLCQWHAPLAHELESWGDVRAADGTVSMIQPMIEPLYGGRTAYELVDVLVGGNGRRAYEIVREHWTSRWGQQPFESKWRRALHDGVVAESALPARLHPPRGGPQVWLSEDDHQNRSDNGGLEISFRPDPAIHDGRFANNGWLQELPRPITRLTWDNAALMSPSTAERYRLRNGQVAELTLGDSVLKIPAWIVPGHAEGSITVHVGYGRPRAGRIGDDVGVDAWPMKSAAGSWQTHGLELRSTAEYQELACTQVHQSMEGRDHVRAGTLADYQHDPEFASHVAHEPDKDMTLYPEHSYDGYSWGMSIDLNACVGCNACVVGCQSENNIPVVGKEEVLLGREMHWIRVDRYFEGSAESPDIWHQPVTCMHCETAPCEPVCPVGATVHSSEGLNDMVYNRCVGTRYCSNNCPYKVRRFNFYLYAKQDVPSLKLLNNPDVTVRTRGVMEKCTYCVQRINQARIESHREGESIKDGDIKTACQQVCPAEAIRFGDINDSESSVSKAKAGPRHYGLLAELGTRPRTTYLAPLRNPNPEIPRENDSGHGPHHDEGEA